MQPYQEEYIANLKEISALSAPRRQASQSFDAYLEERMREKERRELLVARNMELLRGHLFPLLDHMFEAGQETLSSLAEFASALFDGRTELDIGLFCQIRRALLSRARLAKDRNAMIRELYWLGMGYNSLYTKLVGLDDSAVAEYTSQLRLCFMEAAAYLKYFEEIGDTETRGYIIRSRANVSLGSFRSPGEKIRLVKYTLQILQDRHYRELAPELPWERYLYMTHQQMTSSISRSKDRAMTPEDIATVMESVHIVYERQAAEAKGRGGQPSAKISFSYDTINYHLGVDSLDGLLRKAELLMDAADEADYSVDSMYRILSLPAFFCNLLQEYPKKIPARAEYIDSLYRRAMDYVERFPEASRSETAFYYLRQMMTTFIETGSGIPYREFVRVLLMRFLPSLYVHSYTVGRASAALCGMLLEEDSRFFDDIEPIREISDFQEKSAEMSKYSMEGGLLHDVGSINFTNLFCLTARQWFEEEYEMAHLHTLLGRERLAGPRSTAHLAPVALGHHAWYDGSRGYPEEYVRLECPCRQLVDVVGLTDWLDSVTNATYLYTGMKKTFREAVKDAVTLGGRRFSPLLTERLQDEKTAERLEQAFLEGRREAYRQLYEIGETAPPASESGTPARV